MSASHSPTPPAPSGERRANECLPCGHALDQQDEDGYCATCDALQRREDEREYTVTATVKVRGKASRAEVATALADSMLLDADLDALADSGADVELCCAEVHWGTLAPVAPTQAKILAGLWRFASEARDGNNVKLGEWGRQPGMTWSARAAAIRDCARALGLGEEFEWEVNRE